VPFNKKKLERRAPVQPTSVEREEKTVREKKSARKRDQGGVKIKKKNPLNKKGGPLPRSEKVHSSRKKKKGKSFNETV